MKDNLMKFIFLLALIFCGTCIALPTKGMLGCKQNAIDQKSCPYDAQVEWLQSIGNQYVDTQYAPKNGDIIIYDLGESGDTTYQYAFGIYQGSTYFRCDIEGKSRTLKRFLNSISTISTDIDFLDDMHVIETNLKDMYLSIDGGERKNIGSFKDLSRTFWLFGRNFNGILESARKIRHSFFRVIRNHETIIDMIAVRKDGIGCFYDKKRRIFLEANTKTLMIGPDK